MERDYYTNWIDASRQKAEQLYELHHTGELLIFPNIWEPLGAMLLQDLGYPAIATASASIAYTNGVLDGENIPFKQLLTQLKQIVNSVNLPVTADIESGYASTSEQLKENITSLIEVGVVGINIEDTNKATNKLFSLEYQCDRIRLIKKTAETIGVPLFINARTDTYISNNNFNEEEQLTETIKRGQATKMPAQTDCTQ